MKALSPDLLHEYILKNCKPLLEFSESVDYESWRHKVRSKLTKLLGDMPERVEPNVVIEWEREHDTFIEKRFVFDTDLYTKVPCHLLVPKKVKKPCPIVICLQGHNSGMHIALGRVKYDGDEKQIKKPDRDHARQIINEGYAALIMEQRGFGERKSDKHSTKTACNHPGMVALILGKTMIGERVWDVSRAIDALSDFDEIDIERLGCMGLSGGGTATFYSACMDARIKIAMPSCSICTFKDSIGAMHHCTCNYIPNIAKYMDIGDLACLIAPRPLIVVAGDEDPIFPICGVKEAFNTIERIYKKAGAAEKCRLIIGNGGHRFFADPSWSVFGELANWKK